VVQLAAGEVATADLEQELIDYVRHQLAHYKAPRSVDFTTDLSRTPTGKLVKGKVRERYWSEAR
jgi:fatty-acyl-CoA synthase